MCRSEPLRGLLLSLWLLNCVANSVFRATSCILHLARDLLSCAFGLGLAVASKLSRFFFQRALASSRVPIGKEVKVAPVQRTEGDVLIIPVIEEVLVVEKRLVLKEELRISRRTTREDIEVPVTIRKQRAVVERTKTETRNDQEAKR